MKIFTLTFALVLIFPWQAEAQDDGLYWVSDQPTKTQIETLDGKKIYLGAPFTEKIDAVTLTSETNDNMKYQLRLEQIKPFSRDERTIALVLQKQCVCSSGFGYGNGRAMLDWEISDQNAVSNAASFFKIIPLKRQHPGHEFTARFEVNSKGYSVSEPIMVTLVITNCGAQPFLMPSPSLESQLDGGPFAFTAMRWGGMEDNSVENLPREAWMGGPFTILTVQPGDKHTIPVDLKKYLKFKQPGKYSIRGSYSFPIINPDRSHSLYFLWDDFATAEFELTLR